MISKNNAAFGSFLMLPIDEANLRCLLLIPFYRRTETDNASIPLKQNASAFQKSANNS